MKSLRSIVSRPALAAMIAAAVMSAPIAGAHVVDWQPDSLAQADYNVSTAQQALDAARAQQFAADLAYQAAAARVNADRQRVDEIDQAIASLSDNLRSATQAADARRAAQQTIRQRLDAASADAQRAFDDAVVRGQMTREFQQDDRAARDAQLRVDGATRQVLDSTINPANIDQAADLLAIAQQDLKAATDARQRFIDQINRDASLDPAFVATNQAVSREQAALAAVTADLNKAESDRAAIAASLDRAQADVNEARASVARSQQNADATQFALDAANQSVVSAQTNLDSAYSYASYARADRDAAIAWTRSWSPPAPRAVVVVPGPVVVSDPIHHEPTARIVYHPKAPPPRLAEARASARRDQTQARREERFDQSRDQQRQREEAAHTRERAEAKRDDRPSRPTKSDPPRQSSSDSRQSNSTDRGNRYKK